MQVDVDEVMHFRLEGVRAKLVTKVDPELYNAILYAQLGKALHGTMSASMLFWKDLSGHLLGDGFAPNPYDGCVMNKTANGTKCTVLWHVYDLGMTLDI